MITSLEKFKIRKLMTVCTHIWEGVMYKIGTTKQLKYKDTAVHNEWELEYAKRLGDSEQNE